jgi:tRNA nucleotidyltransferase (CCA-adding enzyme)
MLRSMDAGLPLPAAVAALPLGAIRDQLVDAGAYLVGGSIRDLLLGVRPGPDIDIAVEGDLEALLARLEPGAEIEVEAHHRRFGTATLRTGGVALDLTRTRSETYAEPGALPDVHPADIGTDLGRRDFTINAMAVPLADPTQLLDPFGGRADVEARILRVLHERSFIDDPTRAIRGARYAARLGLEPDPGTLDLLGKTDLGTISADRRDAELTRLAGERAALRGFELLDAWGVLPLAAGASGLIAALEERADAEVWRRREGAREAAILLAVAGGEGLEAARRLAHAQPERPSESVRLAAPHSDAELLLAAALGGTWIELYLREWCDTRLEIDGEDLIAAGIPEGPAIGAGLRGALERKLDGGLHGGREEELEVAVALARASI